MSQVPAVPSIRRARLWRRVALLVAAIVLLAGLALALNRLTAKSVTLDISGDVQRLRTHADTVREALGEADVLIDPEDVIRPGPDAPIRNGMTIAVHKAHAVALQTDGDVRQVRTQAAHPLDVLDEQGIVVGSHDVILVNGQEYTPDRLDTLRWDAPLTSIRLVRSVAIRVIDGERALWLHTTQTDVGRALDAAQVELYLADSIEPGLSTPAVDGLVVRIHRSMPIKVVADGQQLKTRARGPTVGDVLAEIGLAPIGLDYTVPPPETVITPEMTIQIVRVSEELVTKEESIPFTTTYQPSTELAPGEERVLQPGAEGVRRRQFRVRYEDGREVSREVEAVWIAQPPTPRLIAYGVRAQ